MDNEVSFQFNEQLCLGETCGLVWLWIALILVSISQRICVDTSFLECLLYPLFFLLKIFLIYQDTLHNLPQSLSQKFCLHSCRGLGMRSWISIHLCNILLGFVLCVYACRFSPA